VRYQTALRPDLAKFDFTIAKGFVKAKSRSQLGTSVAGGHSSFRTLLVPDFARMPFTPTCRLLIIGLTCLKNSFFSK
jgi:hypothetical protein